MSLNLDGKITNTIFGVINEYYGSSKYFNTPYKNYFRMVSKGDGLLHIVVNNFDMKMIQYMNIEPDVFIDKIYLIPEFYNIVSKLKNYTTYNISDDMLNYDDGKVSLIPIPLDKKEIEDVYSIALPDHSTVDDNFIIDETLTKEMERILKILSLKNNKNANSYFNDNDTMFFDFYDVRAKKESFFNYLKSDIFSLKIVSSLFNINSGFEIDINRTDDNFMIFSSNFYVEGRQIKIESIDKNYIQTFFEEPRTQLMKLKTKLELASYVDICYAYDNDSSIYFSKDKAKVNSSAEEFVSEFKNFETEGENEFIIRSSVLQKILKFIFSYDKKTQFFEFNIVKTPKGKFLVVVTDGVELLTEVI